MLLLVVLSMLLAQSILQERGNPAMLCADHWGAASTALPAQDTVQLSKPGTLIAGGPGTLHAEDASGSKSAASHKAVQTKGGATVPASG